MSLQHFDDEHNLPTHMAEGVVFQYLDEDGPESDIVKEWIEARKARIREAYNKFPYGDEANSQSCKARYQMLGWDYVDENGVSHIRHSKLKPFGDTPEEVIRRMHWMRYTDHAISKQTKCRLSYIGQTLNHMYSVLAEFDQRKENEENPYSW